MGRNARRWSSLRCWRVMRRRWLTVLTAVVARRWGLRWGVMLLILRIVGHEDAHHLLVHVDELHLLLLWRHSLKLRVRYQLLLLMRQQGLLLRSWREFRLLLARHALHVRRRRTRVLGRRCGRLTGRWHTLPPVVVIPTGRSATALLVGVLLGGRHAHVGHRVGLLLTLHHLL